MADLSGGLAGAAPAKRHSRGDDSRGLGHACPDRGAGGRLFRQGLRHRFSRTPAQPGNSRRRKTPPSACSLRQIILALCCLGFGIFPTWVVRAINGIPENLIGVGSDQRYRQRLAVADPGKSADRLLRRPAVFFGILVSWLIVFSFSIRSGVTTASASRRPGIAASGR